MRPLNPDLETAAWKLFLQGNTAKQIHRKLGIRISTLTKLIEHGDPTYGKRPWRDRRADIYRKHEQLDDEGVAKTILERSKMLTAIEKTGLKTLRKHQRKSNAKPMTAAEVTMISREATQALRLAADVIRDPKPATQINVSAQANALSASKGPVGAAIAGSSVDGQDRRLTVATVKALQKLSPTQMEAITAYQRELTLAYEEQGMLALPEARQDELEELVPSPAEPEPVVVEATHDPVGRPGKARSRAEQRVEKAPGAKVARRKADGARRDRRKP